MERKDVFNSFLVSDCEYEGEEEMPFINTCEILPNKLITFSNCIRTKDYNQWVMFYEFDYLFMRLWRNPERYLNRLKKFIGVISPDFSLYRNMPLVMQKWSCYKGRALANYLINNGINVIPNVRWGDERTYSFCFDGIKKDSIICVGSVGGMKSKNDHYYFIKGFEKAIEVLRPKIVLIYGLEPKEITEKYSNIKFIIFNNLSFRKEN